MEVLTFEHGEVRLDNELVPGILQNLRVSGKVRFDEQKVDGGSGKKKTPQGWEDCEIVFSLILTNEEESSCYDKLRKLSEMFNAPDDKANPKVMAVTNRHLLARGVRRVVFSRFDSTEADRTDEITVSLGFAEHNPPIVRAEQAQAKSPTPQELADAAAEKAAKEQPTREDILFVDAAGYGQGGKA